MRVRELTPTYFAAAGRPKSIWEVPGASHAGGIDIHARKYEQRVIAFFDHALLAKRLTPSPVRGGRRSWRPRMTILLDFEGHGVGRLLGAAYVAAPRRERRRPRMGRG
jgi:hypothetical protein